MALIDCPKCKGKGQMEEHSDEHKKNRNSSDCKKYGCPVLVECSDCLGSGIWGYD
jgi:DnaJ-class molecular chaperone